MRRDRQYPRLRHGGYLWKWLGDFWIWKPEPFLFGCVAAAELAIATPRSWVAFAAEMVGASIITWVLGWRLARPEDFE